MKTSKITNLPMLCTIYNWCTFEDFYLSIFVGVSLIDSEINSGLLVCYHTYRISSIIFDCNICAKNISKGFKGLHYHISFALKDIVVHLQANAGSNIRPWIHRSLHQSCHLEYHLG